MEESQTQFHGPFHHSIASVHGYLVPELKIIPLDGANDGSVNIILGSFSVCADGEEARKWIPMIAHALAVGDGYTCHGEHSRKANPHKIKIFGIDSAE